MFDESPNVDVHAPEVIAPIPEAVAPEHAVTTVHLLNYIAQDAPHQLSNDFSKGSVEPTLIINLRDATDLILVQNLFEELIFAASTPEQLDTPMVEKSKLDEDKEGKAVDPSHYRGMIGTLLYLTATLQMRIMLVSQDTRRSTSAIYNFWVDRLAAVVQKGRKALRYPYGS
ncbi:hypothetical protein Tco_0596296 [Tanacetum coccineum]